MAMQGSQVSGKEGHSAVTGRWMLPEGALSALVLLSAWLGGSSSKRVWLWAVDTNFCEEAALFRA